MELILIRHAYTKANLEKRYSSPLEPILPVGQSKVTEVCRKLERFSFERILVSPLLRTIETSKLLFDHTDWIMDERLREMDFGDFTGHTFKEIAVKYSESVQEWTKNYKTFCLPNGESYEDCKKRVRSLSEQLINDNVSTLIIAHEGVIQIMIEQILGLNELGFHLSIEPLMIAHISCHKGFATIKKLNY